MNLLLRIIDQSVLGIETKINVPLGQGYTVVMNVKRGEIDSKDPNPAFQDAKDLFFAENPTTIVNGKIVGFIYGGNTIAPIEDQKVYYVVNEEGQNVERIYGQYQKY